MSKAATSGKSAVRLAFCAAVVAAFGIGLATAGDEPVKSGETTGTQKVTTATPQLKPQTICPVMGNEINKSLFVDVNGKRIYICCNACADQIKKNPDKYLKKLEKMGQCAEAIPETQTAATGDVIKAASKDTAAIMAKCPMMNGTSKVKGCYTCTMHPDVMKKEAGKCPKCGMDLVFQKCVMDSSKGRGGCCKMKK